MEAMSKKRPPRTNKRGRKICVRCRVKLALFRQRGQGTNRKSTPDLCGGCLAKTYTK